MTASIRRFFVAMYALVFLGATWLCTGWEPNTSTYASIPIIATAEAIVIGMMYITIFYGAPDPVKHEVVIVPPGKMQVGRREALAQVQR
jgi:hypothetical protein